MYVLIYTLIPLKYKQLYNQGETNLHKENVNIHIFFFILTQIFSLQSLYISYTLKGTWWEGSSPSLSLADHSAGVSHSHYSRLTIARHVNIDRLVIVGRWFHLYNMLLSLSYSMSLSHLCLIVGPPIEKEDFI